MTDIRRNFITCLGEETSVASRLTPVQAVGDGRVVGGGVDGWIRGVVAALSGFLKSQLSCTLKQRDCRFQF